MKIAFISYEYPPDTADGGIGTYVQQAARMLVRHGHHVEVFAATDKENGTKTELEGIVVHRLRISRAEREIFSVRIGPVFQQRHLEIGFDVLEGPEALSEAKGAVRLVPDIPLVIVLHSAGFVRKRLANCPSALVRPGRLTEESLPTVRDYLRFSRRGLQAMRLVDQERLHVLDADEVVSPSQALKKLVVAIWKLDASKIRCVPLPFIDEEAFAGIPIERQSNELVTYIGRLEKHKGVLDIARAIPLVLKERPQSRFRFVGEAMESPDPALTMQQYLEEWLHPYSSSVEFTGKISRERLPAILAETDVCVFPSLFENFPQVVVEGMASGRSVIGSMVGGGREIIDSDSVGRLVAPGRPDIIARHILELLNDPILRREIGLAARAKVLSQLNPDRIYQMRISSYESAIHRRKQLGSRSKT